MCQTNKSKLEVLCYPHFQKLWVVDILLPDHVGLSYVLDFVVHLVHLPTWMGLGGHPETFSLEHSFMVKSCRQVAHGILVSALSSNPSFFPFRDLVGGQGLGLGLNNSDIGLGLLTQAFIFQKLQSTVITIVPPIGPPIVVPVGRAVQNKGVDLDSRFQVHQRIQIYRLNTNPATINSR